MWKLVGRAAANFPCQPGVTQNDLQSNQKEENNQVC